VQSRVLHALLMREVITRFGRENIGVLWLIVEPMIFTLGVAALWTAAGMQHGSSMPIVAFAITGYSSVLLWRNCVGRTVTSVYENRPLLFHRNVKVVDMIVTRCVLEIIGATCSFFVLATIFIALEMIPAPIDLGKILVGWLLLSWFGIALSLTIGGAAAFSHIVEKLWNPAAYLLFPLSGAAFMVDWLPESARQVVLLLPMVHGVEILREGYFGNTVRTHYNLTYMIVMCMALSLIGLWLARVAGKRVEG
jgi:capsular polysaccharide transport system permease protein